MKKNYIQIALIMDRSGSMRDVWKDAVGGFNSFIQQQKQLLNDKDVKISVIVFDQEYDLIIDSKDLQSFEQVDFSKYYPRGMTSLLDAIGITTNRLGTRFAIMNQEDRPEKIIITVMTDGGQNSSKEFNSQQIKDMISEQQSKYNWSYIFLSSDLSAVDEAQRSYGFSPNLCFAHASDSSGYSGSFSRYAMCSDITMNLVSSINEEEQG